MGLLAKFLRLPRSERRLVIGAALTVALVRLELWTLPLATVRRRVGNSGRNKFGRRQGTVSPSRPGAERISWAVGAAARFVPGGSNCLVRALAAEAMLGRFGYQSQLKIGVGKTPAGQFEAHAWLESEGRTLIGQFDLGRYAEMAGPGASRLSGASRL
jgi:hypothetical protein